MILKHVTQRLVKPSGVQVLSVDLEPYLLRATLLSPKVQVMHHGSGESLASMPWRHRQTEAGDCEALRPPAQHPVCQHFVSGQQPIFIQTVFGEGGERTGGLGIKSMGMEKIAIAVRLEGCEKMGKRGERGMPEPHESD